jgi:hypothetical protein
MNRYNPKTLSDLRAQYAAIDWLALFTAAGVPAGYRGETAAHPVILDNPAFFDSLCTFLSQPFLPLVDGSGASGMLYPCQVYMMSICVNSDFTCRFFSVLRSDDIIKTFYLVFICSCFNVVLAILDLEKSIFF